MNKQAISVFMVSVICLMLVGSAAAQITEVQPPQDAINSEYRFGWAIDFDSANNRAILGAYGENADNKSNVGAAFIYTLDNDTWTLEQKITSPDALQEGEFGWDVQIEGNIAMVSATADLDEASAAGKIYVYENQNNTWTHIQTIAPNETQIGDLFGFEMQLTGDTLLVGAPGYDASGSAEDSGAAYVFSRNGDTWTQVQQLTPANPFLNQAFGTSVVFENTYMLIGAPGDNFASGAVYPYRLNGIWQIGNEITASDGEGYSLFTGDFLGDFFGTDVDLSGNTAAISAWQDRNNGSDSEGSVYIFSTTDGATWTEGQKLVADSDDEDGFGFTLDIVNDLLLISADDDAIETNPVTNTPYDDGSGDESGVLYVFQNNNNTWLQATKIEPADNAPRDFFGMQFATDGATALVGAWGDDGSGTNTGSLYVVSLDAILGPPEITVVSPGNGASDVRVNSTLSVTFSKGVMPSGSGGFTFTCNDVAQPFPVPFYDANTFTFTLTPQANLPFGAMCVFTIPTVSLVDSTQQPLSDNQGANDGQFIWTFTTEDAPQIISTTPQNNASDVPVEQSITLVANEALNAVGPGIVLTCNNETVLFTLSVPTALNYVLTPNNNLPDNTDCVLTIPTNSVEDSDGNKLADTDGTADGAYRLSFSTVDNAPRILTTSPSNGATLVANSTIITLTVSEPLTPVAGGFTFTCGGVLQPFPQVTQPTSTTYELQPRSLLPDGATCTLVLPTASLEDATGNPLVNDDSNPNDDNYSLSFTVADVSITAVEESAEVAPMIESTN